MSDHRRRRGSICSWLSCHSKSSVQVAESSLVVGSNSSVEILDAGSGQPVVNQQTPVTIPYKPSWSEELSTANHLDTALTDRYSQDSGAIALNEPPSSPSSSKSSNDGDHLPLIQLNSFQELEQLSLRRNSKRNHQAMSSPRDFTNKVVLVTGSSGGIGAATVKYFAQCGAQVVVNGRNQESINRVAAECNALSPSKYKALTIQADVTKDEDCQRIVDTTINHYGKLDILVNNAGGGAFGSIYDPKLVDTLEHMLKLDVRSVVLITQLAVPHLEKTSGVIVNISSTLSFKPNAHFMPYCIAKCAIDMFTKCICLELGPKGIRVNTVNPTAVRTNFQAATGAGDILDGVLKHLEEVNPLRRIGTTDDVVNAVGFLASQDASFVNGTSLVVDGGSVFV